MRRPVLILSLAALALIGLTGQSSYEPWRTPEGTGVIGQVIYCTTGKPREAAPCGSMAAPMNVMSAPFTRKVRSSFMMPVTTAPQAFVYTQPADATTYRGFNPCAGADVRIMSVQALEPLKTEPTGYPGVARVTSKTEVIDRFSGIRMTRGPETLGSAANPSGGQQRIVSTMLVPIPGYPADMTNMLCEYEIMYGNGG